MSGSFGETDGTARKYTGGEDSRPSEAISESVKEKSWLDVDIHGYIKVLTIGFLFYYLYRHEIGSIVSRWITDPNWTHGFLIPFFSLYFLNQRKTDILNCRVHPNYFGLVVLLLGILFYPFNVVQFRFGTLNSVDMIIALESVVLFLGGWALFKYLWLPVGFLIFAVPIPDRYYVSLTMPMRLLAAKIAGVLLDFFKNIDATVNGVIIDVFHKGQALETPLNVAEACSGMRLLTAFLALGVAMAYLHYRPIWQRLILLASTIPIAIICNIVRVTVTGFIYVFIGSEYASGIYHTVLGLLMLPLAFGLYGSLAWFMSSLFVEESEKAEDIVISHRAKTQD